MEPQGQTIDRLGPADLAMLWTEDAGWRQDIGAIAVLDGGALFDDAGGFRLESVREHIGGRLGWVPRFSQVLHRPRFGLGSPIWVDAGDVDLRHHVGMRPLPAPGNNQQLLELCESLRRAPFDLDRPLWEMWLLPGVDEGRHVGLFIKLHHALADGLAGMAALSAFVDTDPAAVTNPAPPQPTRPMPSSRALFLDNLRSRGRRLGALIAALRRPLPALRGAVCQLRALYQVFGQGRAPRSSLNRPIGPGRRLATIPGSLDVYRDIAHAHAAKVNDVLLAAIGGGVADLLSARGESSHLALRAMVPVSDGDPVRDGTLGNSTRAMLIPLGLDQPNAVSRLRRITEETRMRKSLPQPSMGSGLLKSALVQKLWLRRIDRQRIGNVYLANVPGPPMPLFLAGARIDRLYPMVPIIGNMTLGVGALSYAGQLNVTVVADFDSCPDVGVFVEGFRRSIAELAASVAEPGDLRAPAQATSTG